jgi:hypothetical protein
MSGVNKLGIVVLAGAAAAALGLGEVRGQSQTAPQRPAPAGAPPTGSSSTATPSSTASTDKDERALKALQGMSTTLASAKTLRVKVRNVIPMQLPSGRWVSLIGASQVTRQGQDHLYVETGGDQFHFNLFFDGKTVTAYVPDQKVFAQEEAAGNIDNMLELARKRGKNSFPFADVLVSNPYAAMTANMQDAALIGTSTLGGVETQHLAFTGKEVDWEIWIGTKDQLPRLVVVTDTTDAHKPSFTCEFTDWQLNQPVPPDTFAFKNTTGAAKIPFRDPEVAATTPTQPTKRP